MNYAKETKINLILIEIYSEDSEHRMSFYSNERLVNIRNTPTSEHNSHRLPILERIIPKNIIFCCNLLRAVFIIGD